MRVISCTLVGYVNVKVYSVQCTVFTTYLLSLFPPPASYPLGHQYQEEDDPKTPDSSPEPQHSSCKGQETCQRRKQRCFRGIFFFFSFLGGEGFQLFLGV